jgi:hypothetical protein
VTGHQSTPPRWTQRELQQPPPITIVYRALCCAVTYNWVFSNASWALPRSRPLYNRSEFSGRAGNWADGTAGQGTGTDYLRHLAKVGVAGSNPVFRSKVVGQKRFLEHRPRGDGWVTLLLGTKVEKAI